MTGTFRAGGGGAARDGEPAIEEGRAGGGGGALRAGGTGIALLERAGGCGTLRNDVSAGDALRTATDGGGREG